MCGIVGYVGKQDASPFLFDGIEAIGVSRLRQCGPRDYFGFTRNPGQTFRRRIERLADLVENSPMKGSIGIGHTRWATHGPAPPKMLTHILAAAVKLRWCITE